MKAPWSPSGSGVNPCCCFCPDTETIEAVFSVVGLCPTSCTPRLSNPDLVWVKATSLVLDGLYTLTRIFGPPDQIWQITIPNAATFDNYDDDTCETFNSDATVDVVVTIQCVEDAEGDKHLSMSAVGIDNDSIPVQSYAVFYDLTAPADYFAFDEVVALPGECAGTLTASLP